MTRGSFIVLEGMDGTGKSTVQTFLCQELGAHSFAMPPMGMRPVKPYVDRSLSPTAQICYYISCIIHLSDQIRASLGENHVVCHRYYPSLVANQCYVAGISLSMMEHLIAPFLPSILQPDLTIFLTAELAECRSRLRGRPQKLHGTDLLLLASDQYAASINAVYAGLCQQDNHWITIDTTQLPIESVCKEALGAARDCLNLHKGSRSVSFVLNSSGTMKI